MEFFEIRLPDNLLKSFDRDLMLFYNKVICLDIDLRNRRKFQTMRRYLREILEAYSTDVISRGSSSISYDSVYTRCAYVFKFSACFTSAVAHHLLDLVKQNPSIFVNALKRSHLNICCLGGGPASDVVAFSKILAAVRHSSRFQYRRPFDLNVSIIDINEGWKWTAVNVLQTLLGTSEFFDADHMSLSFQFLKADLTQPMSAAVQEALMHADVVTMVKFFSAVYGSGARRESIQMVQEIVRHMNKEAILFYLDSGSREMYPFITEACRTLNLIYAPYPRKLHMLSLDSIMEYVNMYSDYLSFFFCQTCCVVTTMAWSVEKRFDFLTLPASTEISLYRTARERKFALRQKARKKAYELKVLRIFLDYFGFNYDSQDLEEVEQESSVCVEFFQTKAKSRRFCRHFSRESL